MVISFPLRCAGFEIVPAGPERTEELLALYLRCEDFLALNPLAPRADLEMIQRDLTTTAGEGGYYCAVQTSAGELLGVVDFIPGGFEGHPDQAFLELLMLPVEQRGQGLGARVLACLEEALRLDPRVSWLLAGCQVNNPGALRFWQKHGFEVIKPPEVQPDGTLCVLLRKRLR